MDQILMSQRGGSYGNGRWHVLSGKLDPDEPLPDGAARVLLEETGLDLRWFDVHDLPDDIIEYPAAGLRGYLSGTGTLTLHDW
ncbi:NUDIX domain-containing protein [Streptomyces sp. NPDC002589]|uniref:NUDIX domain-containing protein n=1 Tax=Streptomyces sp. NPDC002589 TaxID=3154420 RepID=UPI00331E7758